MADRPTPSAKVSRRNRDHERLYRPGSLSKWFLLFSGLLVASLIWMFWKDYNRAWKDYQRGFFDKQLEMARAETAEATAKLEEDRDAIKAAKAKVDLEFRKLERKAERRAELGEQVHALGKDFKAADAELKRVKGLVAPARYQYETAQAAHAAMQRALEHGHQYHHNDVDQGMIDDAAELMEELRIPYARFSQMEFEANGAFRSAAVELREAEDALATLESPWADAKAELAELRAEVAVAEAKLEGLEGLYDNNRWRNAPFIDFISPTMVVRQVVLEDIHDNWNFATNRKVDRCQTCHLGIDMPMWGNETKIKKFELEPYMQAHTGIELMAGPGSPHKVERFGCTVCHHGIGWSTDFARAVHTPQNAEQKADWKENHGWYKAKYIEYPMVPTRYVQGQCFKCHHEGMFYPVAYPETLEHGWLAPTAANGLDFGQMRYDEGEVPADKQNRRLGPWEVHSDYALPPAPTPIDGTMGEVAKATEDALYGHFEDVLAGVGVEPRADGAEWDALDRWVDGTVHDYGWRADVFEQGYNTITRYGCQGCHKIGDFGTQVGYPDQPPRIGPNLTYIADKVRPEWLDKWIKHPDVYRPDTKMPSFFWFLDKDGEWTPRRNADGSLKIMPVQDAHMLDPELAAALGPQATPDDLATAAVQVLAMKTYLLNQQNPKAAGAIYSRANPADPAFDEVYLTEPPEGDIENGRELVSSLGCIACHVVPEVKNADGEWEPDSTYRFGDDPLYMRGPRLTSLGSKMKDRKWMNAWLIDPRHYTSTTNMPDMRIEDRFDPVTGEQIVSGAQQRADIIDYLLSKTDPEWDALAGVGYKPSYAPILGDMYETYFGKTPQGDWLRRETIEGDVSNLGGEQLATVLAKVGERLMGRNGCFGCHEVAGHENDMPIGVELSTHGQRDIHQFDFGVVHHPKIEHTRWGFFYNKVLAPRIWDHGKIKIWQDKLRMPRFNFWDPTDLDEEEAAEGEADEAADASGEGAEAEDADDFSWAPPDARHAVTAMVTGLVNEPIKTPALFRPDDYQRDVIAGRRIVQRYGCNNCHTIEGQKGLLWGWHMDTFEGMDAATLPPNLFSQGLRTRTDWLVKFLKNPKYLRPIVKFHMPRYGLTDEEAECLARYFVRLAGREQSLIIPRPDSVLSGHRYDKPLTIESKTPGKEPVAIGPITGYVDEAKRLFETVNCNKCHLPLGWPGGDPNDGGVAPSFEHAKERLRYPWVRALLYSPSHLIDGTKMPQFWPQQRKYGRLVDPAWTGFQFWLRDDRAWRALFTSENEADRDEAMKQLADVQIEAITDYLLHHYTPPAPPSEPAVGGGR